MADCLHLLALLALRVAQPDARTTAVLLDEDNACCFERLTNDGQ